LADNLNLPIGSGYGEKGIGGGPRREGRLKI